MVLKFLLNTQMIWMIFENIEEYNPDKKRKIFIFVDDKITDILYPSFIYKLKKLYPLVTELTNRFVF